MPQETAMSFQEMEDTIDKVAPGDRLEIIFADGDVPEIRLRSLLEICHVAMGGDPYLSADDDLLLDLCGVYTSRSWSSLEDRKCVFTVLHNWKPKHFIYRLLRSEGFVQSVKLIDPSAT